MTQGRARLAGYLVVAFGTGMFAVDSLARLDGWQGHATLPAIVFLVVAMGLLLVFSNDIRGRLRRRQG